MRFKNLRNIATTALVVLASALSVPAEVLAEDTDVFFPENAVSGQGAVAPNILFVIDDSGSMITNKDGTGLTRLQRVKDAFGQLMDGISSNTNAGLMRFSYQRGGPVVFPVANVEKLIKEVDPVNLATFTDIVQPTVTSAGDFDEAEQATTAATATPLNAVGIGVPLFFGFHGTTSDFLASQEQVQCGNGSGGFDSAAGTLNFTNDNKLLNGSGGNGTTKDPVYLIYGKGPCSANRDSWVGYRFTNLSSTSAAPATAPITLALPTDAVVTDARLVLTAFDNDGLHRSIRVYGQKNNADSADNTGSGHNTVFGTDDTLAGSAAQNAVSSSSSATSFNSKRLPTNGSRTPQNASSATPAFLNGSFAGYVDTNLYPLDATDDQPYATGNLADIVNEVKWCKNGATNPSNGICANNWGTSNDSVNLLITAAAHGTGTLSARSMNTTASKDAAGNNDNGYDPKLEVAYTSSSAPPVQVVTALRFQNVQIPKGATLTSAYLSFNQDAIGGNSTTLPVDIYVEASDDSQPFSTTDDLRNSTTARPWVSSSQSVTLGQWNSPFTAVTTNKNADNSANVSVKSLLQQTVNRTGWCGGQAVSFKFQVSNATAITNKAFRRAISAAQNDSSGPQLVYSYASDDAALATGCFSKLPTATTVATSLDDASQNTAAGGSSGGTITTTATTLNFGCTSTGSTCTSDLTGAKNTVIGLRFAHIAVPQGATITSASISFTSSAANSAAAAFTVRAQNSTNAPVFVNAAKGDLRDRYNAATSGTVNWTPEAYLAPNTNTNPTTYYSYSTPDLTSIIQPIITNTGWVFENSAMVFLVAGSGVRSIYSFDGGSGYAPQLNISYKSVTGRLTVRNYLKLLVNQLTAPSYTPSVGTLYEAARYFRGESAYFGITRGFANDTTFGASTPSAAVGGLLAVSAPSTFIDSSGHQLTNNSTTYPCTADALTDPACAHEYYTGTPVYKTPITDACQQNSLVFLTDGGPNQLSSTELTKVKTEAGVTSCADANIQVSASSGGASGGGACGPELADYLFNTDQSPLVGNQHISTYAIQFAVGAAADGSDYAAGSKVPASNWLKRLAGWTGPLDATTHDPTIAPAAGRGAYYAASDAASLLTAFKAIVSSIRAIDNTFVSPAVTVNTYNRLTNRNELYFALFRPALGVNWPGNIKRYQLRQQTGDAFPQIYDASSPPVLAVDPSTGFFGTNACSFWTPTAQCPDGFDVSKGGAASNLAVPRTVFTYLTNVNLTDSSNAINSTNISTTLLGDSTMDNTTRDNLISWINGYNSTPGASSTAPRTKIGDPLHSEPTLVSYGGTGTEVTTTNPYPTPNLSLYVGDNEGYLHSINANTGIERWAFLPSELLDNPNTYFHGGGTYTNRKIGVDGPITTWTTYNQLNSAGQQIPNNKPEAVPDNAFLYAGMRRGGQFYYGLDIKDQLAPKFAFKIDTSTTGFADLGQTWSRALPVSIRTASGTGGATVVNQASTGSAAVMFAGGYDPSQDAKTILDSGNYDAMGQGLYVIDAKTGALLWSATNNGTPGDKHVVVPGLHWSVPASPFAVDLDGDGFVDRIYLVDTGGQVIRIILAKDSTGKRRLDQYARVTVIATLADATVSGARRFFNTADVALITQGTNTPYLSIAIGTGHREKPLTTAVQDRFYVIRDPDISNGGTSTGTGGTGPVADDALPSSPYPIPTSTPYVPYFPITLTLNNAMTNQPDLIDVTANTAQNISDASSQPRDAQGNFKSKGFYINLSLGEKAITESTTLNNTVFFSTFQPNTSSDPTGCTASAGQSRLYEISIMDGQPTQDFGTGTLTRFTVIKVAGLPPDPLILFPDIYTKGDGTKCNGEAECACASNEPNCTRTPVSCEVFVGSYAVKCDALKIKKTKWRTVQN